MKVIPIVLAVLALSPLVARGQVTASLVTAQRSVQPGQSATVALRLEHAPRWHSYWVNAGTGYGTSLQWELPLGWTAGAIQWPTPTLLRDAHGTVTGHGYEGILYLPITISVPTDAKIGERIPLKAQAKWLMCADVCIPGSAAVSAVLPVSDDAPKSDAGVLNDLARMPMPMSTWKTSATRSAHIVTLTVAGVGSIRSPHFFGEEPYVQYDLPQTATLAGGTLRMALPIAKDANVAIHELIGVLAYTDERGIYRGVKVSAPIHASGATAVSPAESAAGVFAVIRSVASAGRNAAGASICTGSTSLLATMLLAFVGGLILNLMPCVFPVLGIKIVGFVNEAGHDRRQVAMHGLMFTLGVLLSFWVLAGVLAALRAGGQELGWGFQLQSAPFVFALTVIILVFALSLSGVFEFGLRATTVGSALHTRGGIHGSFFAGVLATMVATPCSAPFLAPALGAALALPVAQSFAVFTVIGLGLSAPYLLCAIFPQALRVLPRPGRWMITFKQLMAFPLYATVAYLIWVLAGQTSETGLLMVLLGLTVIAMAVWLYGHYYTPHASRSRVRFAASGALVLMALGLNVGWPQASTSADMVWEKWSTERVAQLRADDRPIYVDFTARWCATCQTNKKVVFASADVKNYFRERKVALLKADWTNADPHITSELARWNRSAVPFNLVYLPQRDEAEPLPEILTPGVVLAAFKG